MRNYLKFFLEFEICKVPKLICICFQRRRESMRETSVDEEWTQKIGRVYTVPITGTSMLVGIGTLWSAFIWHWLPSESRCQDHFFNKKKEDEYKEKRKYWFQKIKMSWFLLPFSKQWVLALESYFSLDCASSNIRILRLCYVIYVSRAELLYIELAPI